MVYRWFAFAAGAVLFALLAWYFGRPVVPVQHASNESVGVAAATPAAEVPTETSPKVIEVIDLARAYDPIRDVESPMPGEINPASFIEEQYAPARIPYAVNPENEYRDLLIRIRETPLGSFLLSVPLMKPEQINIKPREVNSFPNEFVFEKPKPGQFVVAPMGYTVLIEPYFPYERLNVMPREVK